MLGFEEAYAVFKINFNPEDLYFYKFQCGSTETSWVTYFHDLIGMINPEVRLIVKIKKGYVCK